MTIASMLSARTRVQDYFVIEGGVPLQGRIRPEGNKNAALPLLAASLLTAEPVVIDNVPRIRDVDAMLELLDDLGGEASFTGPSRVRLCAAEVRKTSRDARLAERIRASLLLAGPLLARCGRVELPPPGGDVIGRRRVDTHLLAFEALGATADVGQTYQVWAEGGLRGTELFLDEASVTGTENAIMAAVLAAGETTILNAACEPHVQDLCRLLVSMGADIEGIGSNVVRIRGQRSLRGCEHRVCPDHIEVWSFIGLAAVTGGDVPLEGREGDELPGTPPAVPPPR